MRRRPECARTKHNWAGTGKPKSGSKLIFMTLKLPKGRQVGTVVEVAWDVVATEKRSGHIVYEGYFDARIIALDGPLCKLHFDYNPPDGVVIGIRRPIRG